MDSVHRDDPVHLLIMLCDENSPIVCLHIAFTFCVAPGLNDKEQTNNTRRNVPSVYYQLHIPLQASQGGDPSKTDFF